MRIGSAKSGETRRGQSTLVFWWIPLAIFLGTLGAGTFVRFEGITEQGMSAGDGFYYLAEAKLWADREAPEFYSGRFYRPVAYLLDGWAVRYGGYNDYSIKVLSASMDTINLVLIFVIGCLLGPNAWCGAGAALLYAFPSTIIRWARNEMVHVQSGTFVLLAFFSFVVFYKLKDKGPCRGMLAWTLLFLSGFSSALAANVHPDLAFLGPGYIVCLLITTQFHADWRRFARLTISRSAVFTLGFVIPYLIGFAAFGFETVIDVFTAEMTLATSGRENVLESPGYLMVMVNILHYSLKYAFLEYLTSTYFDRTLFFLLPLLAAPIAMGYRAWRGSEGYALAYCSFILLMVYCIGYTLTFNAFEMRKARIFVPLIPLVTLTISYWSYSLAKGLPRRTGLILYLVFISTLFGVTSKRLPGNETPKSQFRAIHDILKDKVNGERRVLIAPVIAFSFDRGFQSDLYFGKEGAVYFRDLTAPEGEYNSESLGRVLQDQKIGYVFISPILYRKLLRDDHNQSVRSWVFNPPSPYTLEKDRAAIIGYINRHRGGQFINVGEWQLYEVNKPVLPWPADAEPPGITKLTIAIPNVTDEGIIVETGEDFVLSGWYASDSPRTIVITLNGIEIRHRFVRRVDAEAAYPYYEVVRGFESIIPNSKLLESNVIEITVDGHLHYEKTFELESN